MSNLQLIINEFLNKFCTEVQPNDNVELMMDDHDYIEYDNKGWYIPKNNSFYTKEDEFIQSSLINKYSI